MSEILLPRSSLPIAFFCWEDGDKNYLEQTGLLLKSAYVRSEKSF